MKTRLLAAVLVLAPTLALAQDQTKDRNLTDADIAALLRAHDDAPSVPGTAVSPAAPSVAGGVSSCADADCFGQRAFNERLAGDLSAAMRDCNAALKLDPRHAGVLQVRAMVYSDQGDNDRALADIEKAIKWAPTDGLGYYLRGVIHFSNKEYDKTVDDETKAIALTPADAKGYLAEAFTQRAAAYGVLKQYDQSLSDLNKSLALAEDPAAYSNRAILNALRGEYPRAISDGEKAVSMDPTFSNAYATLGAVYFETGQYEKGLSAYQKDSDALVAQVARRKTPFADQQFFLSAPYTGMAACQLRLGDTDKAAATYKKAIELDSVWTSGAEAAIKKVPTFEFLPKGKAANAELVKLVKP
jgi:tetratricopeptide (TPR) repeat protein